MDEIEINEKFKELLNNILNDDLEEFRNIDLINNIINKGLNINI